jgi:hypothetical protein
MRRKGRGPDGSVEAALGTVPQHEHDRRDDRDDPDTEDDGQASPGAPHVALHASGVGFVGVFGHGGGLPQTEPE